MADKTVDLTVTLVPIDLIDDNPYNPRVNYPDDEIDAMGDSIIANGILEIPEGRRLESGRVQLAFGHKRLRGVRRNDKKTGAAKWKTFPVVLRELTDTEVLDKAIEENLQRSDVKPIEVARALAAFSKAHPEIKDKDIAKKHGMSEGQISNMKRVLKLPQKFLDMIDTNILSFTQGRELLTLADLPNAEQMMHGALTAMISNHFPDTVEGLKQAIEIVNPAKESKKPRKQKEVTKEQEAPAPGTTAALEQHEQAITEATTISKTTEEPKNISQEKFSTETAVKETNTAQNETKAPEIVTKEAETVTKSAAKTTRTMLLEETEKGVNISFSTAKGGLIIRGVLGTLDTVFAELPAILKEMTAETKGGKK